LLKKLHAAPESAACAGVLFDSLRTQAEHKTPSPCARSEASGAQ
jgi:hypothetical protein